MEMLLYVWRFVHNFKTIPLSIEKDKRTKLQTVLSRKFEGETLSASEDSFHEDTEKIQGEDNVNQGK